MQAANALSVADAARLGLILLRLSRLFPARLTLLDASDDRAPIAAPQLQARE